MTVPANHSDDFVALLARAVEGALSNDEAQRLEQILAADPAARQRYVDHLLLDSMLCDELGVESVAGVIDMLGDAPVSTPLAPKPQQPHWRWRMLAAAAVLLALLSGFLVMRGPGPGNPALAATQVIECNGRLDLISPEGDTREVSTGQTLRSGQALRTGSDDSFAVLTRDALRLELNAETTVRLLDEDEAARGRRVHLSQGSVRVESAAAADGRPMIVSTPHASIAVGAATFTCSTTPEATYVEVEEGKVRMIRQADGAPVEVADGFTSVATADAAEKLVTQPMPAPPMRPPTTFKTAGVSQLAFAPDGGTLTSWAAGHAVAWDLKTNQRKLLDSGVFEGRGIVLSSDGRVIAGHNKKHEVKVLDLTGPRELLAFTLSGRGILALALSGDGTRLAVVEHLEKNRMQARVWDVASGKELPSVTLRGKPARALCLSSDGALMALGSENGNIVLADATAGRELARLTLPGPVRALCLSTDGRWLAGTSSNGTLVLWNVEARAESWRTQAPGQPFLSVAFSPGGQLLAAGTADGTVKLLRTEEGEERLSLRATPGVRAMAFSRDGLILATATKKAILCWHLPENAAGPARR